MHNIPELLAPAGDMASLTAAIACGADAVYLGAQNFNARMKAQNFSSRQLAEAISFAHFHGVKVYVTVNTILQNSEFKQLYDVVKEAVLAKADAFLVQDLGAAAFLRERFEGIVLHASTQMGVHNLYGAQMAQRAGIKRVVLSRETSLEDIRQIRRNTPLELEYFVQGALCVCFSGNCYLSATEQGASGNRGLCKQMCRLPYSLTVGDKRAEGYLLSARDLSLAGRLDKLAEAGITSFKIEGRLRRAGYVASAVSVYRCILDGLASAEDGEKQLKLGFCRGEFLKDGYLDGGNPCVVDRRTAAHTGLKIGVVERVEQFKKSLYKVVLRLDRPIGDGDGLKMFEDGEEKLSLGVGGVEDLGGGRYSFVTAYPVKAGQEVRLTLDAAYERSLFEISPLKPVSVCAVAQAGKPLLLTASCDVGGKSVQASAEGDEPLQRAVAAPAKEEDISRQLAKCKGEGFELADLKCELGEAFVPASALNEMRRRLYARLKAQVIEAAAGGEVKIKPFEAPKVAMPAKAQFRVKEFRTFKGEDLGGCDIAALYPAFYDKRNAEAELKEVGDKQIALVLPCVAGEADLRVIEEILAAFPQIKTLVSRNLYGLYFADRGYKVLASPMHNVANDFAAQEVVRLGACAVCPSAEYKDGISDGAGAVTFQLEAPLPLMTLIGCPLKAASVGDCAHCAYRDGIRLEREDRAYALRRTRLSRCVFELLALKNK